MNELDVKNNELIDRMNSLYMDFYARIKLDNWKKLLNCEAVWDMNNTENVRNIFMSFLDKHRFLPKDIWIFLNQKFECSKIQNSVYNENSNELIEYIVKQIKERNPLSYKNFENIEGVDLEKYLEYREISYNSIKNNDIQKAKIYLINASKLYQGDSELFQLQGLLYIKSDEIQKAVSMFKKYICTNSENCFTDDYRTIIKYEEEKYEKGYDGNNIKMLVLIAQSYFNIGAYEISKEYVMKAIKLQPTNEAKNLLSQINAKIRRGITEELKKQPDNKFLKDQLVRIESDIFTKSNEKVEKADNKFIANNLFKIFLAITILFILIILKMFY